MPWYLKFLEMGNQVPLARTMTGRMLEAVEKLFAEQRPDAVMVYGDTNRPLAGALPRLSKPELN